MSLPENVSFTSSISVRIGTTRRKIELSPAEQHGGPSGCWRVRIDRRWHDLPEGGHIYLTPDQLSNLITHLALGHSEELASVPQIPTGTRVSVYTGKAGASPLTGGFTLTSPFRLYSGLWAVAVQLFSGIEIRPVSDLKGGFHARF